MPDEIKEEPIKEAPKKEEPIKEEPKKEEAEKKLADRIAELQGAIEADKKKAEDEKKKAKASEADKKLDELSSQVALLEGLLVDRVEASLGKLSQEQADWVRGLRKSVTSAVEWAKLADEAVAKFATTQQGKKIEPTPGGGTKKEDETMGRPKIGEVGKHVMSEQTRKIMESIGIRGFSEHVDKIAAKMTSEGLSEDGTTRFTLPHKDFFDSMSTQRQPLRPPQK